MDYPDYWIAKHEQEAADHRSARLHEARQMVLCCEMSVAEAAEEYGVREDELPEMELEDEGVDTDTESTSPFESNEPEPLPF